jgi:hypothetical protein
VILTRSTHTLLVCLISLVSGSCAFDDLDIPPTTTYFGDGLPPTEAAPPVFRRLTASQLANSARALAFGHALRGTQFFDVEALVPDGSLAGFSSNAVSPANAAIADGLMRLGERVGEAARPDLLVSCDLDSVACQRILVARVLMRAFRRPPTGVEIDRYSALAATDVALLYEAVIQSPHFLYLVERGTVEESPGLRRLTGYEVAARLSYALWDGPPDDLLFDDAASGLLDTRGGIERQARRMLLDARARPTIERFVGEWFGITAVPRQSKSPSRFPDYNAHLANEILRDSLGFASEVIFDERGCLTRLLFGDNRHGLLTRRAWLTAHAHADVTSPTRRGRFVREHLLCTEVPSPPGNLVVAPIVFDPERTPREQLKAHTEDTSCSGCHDLMDPLGFPFERYDAIGIQRDVYPNGRPLNLAGSVTLDSTQHTFVDGRDLSRKLASSSAVRRCVVRQWFRFALGRFEVAEDAASLASMERAFEEKESVIHELLVSVAVTDAFRYRAWPIQQAVQ